MDRGRGTHGRVREGRGPPKKRHGFSSPRFSPSFPVPPIAGLGPKGPWGGDEFKTTGETQKGIFVFPPRKISFGTPLFPTWVPHAASQFAVPVEIFSRGVPRSVFGA